MQDEESNIKLGHRLENNKVMDFLLGGHAFFTVKNSLTGNHISYQVMLSNKSQKPIYFVKAKSEFIGTIFDKNKFVYSKKSSLDINSPEVKGFAFVFYRLLEKALPENVEVWHQGKCCRCGRVLKHPDSILTGYGPECFKSISEHDKLKSAIRGKKKMDKEYDRIVKYY